MSLRTPEEYSVAAAVNNNSRAAFSCFPLKKPIVISHVHEPPLPSSVFPFGRFLPPNPLYPPKNLRFVINNP